MRANNIAQDCVYFPLRDRISHFHAEVNVFKHMFGFPKRVMLNDGNLRKEN